MDLEEGDLNNFLDADRVPLLNEELIQMGTERALGEELESEHAVCQQLTAKNFTNTLSYFEHDLKILLQNYTDEACSAKVSRRGKLSH